MESRKFTVYNRTRESTLGTSVASVNAALEPLKVLKVLIEGLPTASRTGLWLTNFKGVPVARTLSPFDLIYLDKDNKVLHGVELSRDGEFAPFKGKPSSALVLPSQSLASSHTREGDQLELTLEETEAKPEASRSTASPVLEKASTAALAPPPTTLPPPAPGIAPRAQFFSPFPTPASVPVETPKPPDEEQLKTAPSPAVLEKAASASPEIGGVAPLERVSAPSQARPTRDRDFFTPAPPAPTVPEAPTTGKIPLVVPPPPRTLAPEIEIPASDSSLQISQPRTKKAAAPHEEAPALPPPLSIQEAPSSLAASGYGPPVKRNYSWKVRLLRWLFPHLVIDEPDQPPDRRRADRQSLAGLVAYYFTGGSPEPQRIGNISVTGFYLHTDERWMPGTVVRMTLQRVGTKGDDPSDTIVVNSRIVRWGPDGEGFEFILTDPEN
jgi:hypothetical protein